MFPKEKLHHAYCVEGDRTEAMASVKNFIGHELKIKIVGNPDVLFLEYDTFAIDDGRMISDMAIKKPFGERRVFVIAFNFITREAQNSLLKLFEEPAAHTNFFLIAPSAVIFLPTLKSRLMFVKLLGVNGEKPDEASAAEKFLKAPLAGRLRISKKLADSVTDEEKSKAEVLSFLERVERRLYRNKSSRGVPAALEEVVKAKRLIFGRSPAVKMILEHIALVLPPKT